VGEQFTIVAHILAKPDKIDETRKFLLNLVPATRKEAGLVNYDLHQDNENPAEFTFYENWKTRADWDHHMTLPHLEEFARRADELFAVPVHIRKMTMISTPA
jgi:quinol monooxygenase YgiN